MSNELTKRIDSTATPKPADNASSRLMGMMMEDAFKSMFSKSGSEKPPVTGTPRVLFAAANFGRRSTRERVKRLQRELYEAAPGLRMKFGFYGADDARGVRRCLVTRHWSDNAETMAGLMDKADCDCGGCYVLIRSLLQQAVTENEERPMSAVIVLVDSFHDDLESLDEAAIAIRQLRQAGTRVILLQQGGDLDSARNLRWLAQVAGAVFLPFDAQQDQQLLQMWAALAALVTGGEEKVRAEGGPAGQLLLEHLQQAPMAPIESPVATREHVRVKRED